MSIISFQGLTEDTSSEKQSGNNIENKSTVKSSSNKRSHSHVRKNSRPTRHSRAPSKRQHASNSFFGSTSEALNNNSDEEILEAGNQQPTFNSNLFNSFPSPAKRLSLPRPSHIIGSGPEGKSKLIKDHMSGIQQNSLICNFVLYEFHGTF